jgi:hypothetical protein
MSGLQRRIEDSELSEQDKGFWLKILETMDDEQAQMILDSVEDDEHELSALTRNIKLKQVAFATGDDMLLGQILEDEAEEIMSI